MYKNDTINNQEFSMLMSIYAKESASNLKYCFDSLLNQTVPATEWVIVKDGPLTDELEQVLKQYDKENPGLIKYIEFSKNQGLGLALQAGVPKCSFNLIARMDSDDYAVPERFEKQLAEFEADPNLDACGSQIKEFDTKITNVISERRVPLDDESIKRYQRRRSSVNHMTVMLKKDSVLDSGNYEHAPLMEDDMLWTRMMLNGCKFKNIDQYLVYARTGKAMIERRGGWSYFKKFRKSRKKIYETGYISYWDYLVTIIVQFVVAMVPGKLRLWIFTNLLRKD